MRQVTRRTRPRGAQTHFWQEPIRRAIQDAFMFKEVGAAQMASVRALIGQPLTDGMRYLLLMRGYFIRSRLIKGVAVLQEVGHLSYRKDL